MTVVAISVIFFSLFPLPLRVVPCPVNQMPLRYAPLLLPSPPASPPDLAIDAVFTRQTRAAYGNIGGNTMDGGVGGEEREKTAPSKRGERGEREKGNEACV